ncbi:MAG: 3'-5' exonuclease [Flammeovirgaceae bacterium]|nr:3'-5' exonuclease [Flammeovirgaceae bacterium]MBE63451.1 3'-5' exonuclease [Flammeovirgaceae bacterium]MBR06171.1 3'-5' exonuclease [Rickettsiales bacterium]HCX20425.1 3'-5' exonuclease [Cytophagales bacterium]|tara:strand:+ start:10767 stop:11492 length:726 start_codon:yes stop_codon:yes gene_type:complete
MDYRLRNLLILDIETVALTKEYQKLNADLRKHWERKSSFLRNEDELTSEELFSEKAGIYAEFGKVITVAFGIFHDLPDGSLALRVKSVTGHDEAALLKEIKDLLETIFDPENLRLCAHNGKEFDFPYLSRRMLINGIKLPYVLDNSGKKPWEVNFLDTMEMWKFGDRKNFTSLDLLTTIFNIPSSKSDIDGSMVNKVYYEEENGLERIQKYCQGDVVATAQLFLKMNALPVVDEKNITIVS